MKLHWQNMSGNKETCHERREWEKHGHTSATDLHLSLRCSIQIYGVLLMLFNAKVCLLYFSLSLSLCLCPSWNSSKTTTPRAPRRSLGPYQGHAPCVGWSKRANVKRELCPQEFTMVHKIHQWIILHHTSQQGFSDKMERRFLVEWTSRNITFEAKAKAPVFSDMALCKGPLISEDSSTFAVSLFIQDTVKLDCTSVDCTEFRYSDSMGWRVSNLPKKGRQ